MGYCNWNFCFVWEPGGATIIPFDNSMNSSLKQICSLLLLPCLSLVQQLYIVHPFPKGKNKTRTHLSGKYKQFYIDYLKAKGTQGINKKTIKENLLQTATDPSKVKEFLRLFVAYLCIHVFFYDYTPYHRLTNSFVPLIFELEKVSWPDRIHDCLMDAIDNCKDSSKLGGFSAAYMVKPKNSCLSKYLLALLAYGGVPQEYFMNILTQALEDAQNVHYDKHAAWTVALKYGEMDNFLVPRMILSGIPIDEPYLQDHLRVLMNQEKESLKGGKLPVSESYYLMGPVDPTWILNRDETKIKLQRCDIN